MGAQAVFAQVTTWFQVATRSLSSRSCAAMSYDRENCGGGLPDDSVPAMVAGYALPPLGFYWNYGLGLEFGASTPLTLLGWIPGVIYAVAMFDKDSPEVEKPNEGEFAGKWCYAVSDGIRSFNLDKDETGGLCFQQEIPYGNQGACFVSGKLHPL